MSIEEIIDEKETNYTVADKFTRLANYTIDGMAFTAIVFLHAVAFSDSGLLLEGTPLLGVYLLGLYVLFHTVFEQIFQKTPGKFVTRTHVVAMNGDRPSFTKILGRNIGRLLPFNNVSFVFFKTGWHDKVSGTVVVHDK